MIARRSVIRPGARARALFRSLAAASAIAVGFLSCSSGSRSPEVPVATLASNAASQAAFRHIETQWADLPSDRHKELEREVRSFLNRFGEDERARSARLYLALIALDQGHFAEAHALIHYVQTGPAGSTRDYADVVEAMALRREGKLPGALALLEPLRGKIADTEQRSIYSEQLVRALVSAHAYEQAIVAMLDWAEQTPQVERERVVDTIDGLIRTMPTLAVEAGLRALSAEDKNESAGQKSARDDARRWLITAARDRLVTTALTTRDPELARRLVESSPVRLGHDEDREALVALAATGLGSARVAGRSLGVVLDVSDDVSRRRSSEVVEGLTRALGLPAATDARTVQLLTRDADDRAGVERALHGLAGDGAGIIVAGVTDDAAVAASLFAERAQVPVLLVSHPAALAGPLRFTLVVGAGVAEESAAVDAAVAAARVHSPYRVGPGGAPCDTVSPAGSTRFPVEEWKRGGMDALILLGDVQCSRDASAEAEHAGLSPLIVVGLDSGEAEDGIPGRKLVVSAGRFPFGAAPMTAEEHAYVERWGSAPSWFEALGHDAAVLAALTLADFPLDRVEDKGAVVGLHWRAQGRLLHAEGALWTTERRGFGGASVLPRTMKAVAPGGASNGLR